MYFNSKLEKVNKKELHNVCHIPKIRTKSINKLTFVDHSR